MTLVLLIFSLKTLVLDYLVLDFSLKIFATFEV